MRNREREKAGCQGRGGRTDEGKRSASILGSKTHLWNAGRRRRKEHGHSVPKVGVLGARGG